MPEAKKQKKQPFAVERGLSLKEDWRLRQLEMAQRIQRVANTPIFGPLFFDREKVAQIVKERGVRFAETVQPKEFRQVTLSHGLPLVRRVAFAGIRKIPILPGFDKVVKVYVETEGKKQKEQA